MTSEVNLDCQIKASLSQLRFRRLHLGGSPISINPIQSPHSPRTTCRPSAWVKPARAPPNGFATVYTPLRLMTFPVTSSSFIINPDSPSLSSDLSVSAVTQAPVIADIQPLSTFQPPTLPSPLTGPITPPAVGPPQAPAAKANDLDPIESSILAMFDEALETQLQTVSQVPITV